VPSAPPDGQPAPDDGTLPPSVAEGAEDRLFGVYLHVPFCATRCGYCDFNTYTAEELGGVRREDYAETVAAEIGQAVRVIAGAGLPARTAATVFLGGGTPTLLPAADLNSMLDAVREGFELADGAEVTVEANPDTVSPASLRALAGHGVTRVSLGMQSAVPHVLATLERTHDPQRVPEAVAWARDAGLAVSLDLIYGTPGESPADWMRSLEAALACGPDHLSAYALVVEPGTRLAARVRRGDLPAPEDDDLAELRAADDALAGAGFRLVRGDNWARAPSSPAAQPRVQARGRLVGVGPLLARWRRAVVERAAPGRTPGGSGPVGRPRPVRCDPDQRHTQEGDARRPAGRGAAAGRRRAVRARGSAGLLRRGLLDAAAAEPERCSPGPAASSPTRSYGNCWTSRAAPARALRAVTRREAPTSRSGARTGSGSARPGWRPSRR
jgi:oxygen-independent coproporphyrinogen-3 oxidase